MIAEPIRTFLTNEYFLLSWGLGVTACLTALLYDLICKNASLASMMKLVWTFTVLYSGPPGLAGYYYAGRRQIIQDTLWRRAFRSVAHCYSGCGAGEIIGVLITAGLLSLENLWIAVSTFLLAYAAGFALTVGPLVQGSVGLHEALWDAFYSETASITVMEIVAIYVDLWISGDATIGDQLFWSSMMLSLSAGLVAAYPVNVLLVAKGVKSGMHSPKEMAA